MRNPLYPSVRQSWLHRPGWSKFGEWRKQGTHQGYDRYCPEGTPVYAAGVGTIVKIESSLGSYLGAGHYVSVDYGGGVEISVWHLQQSAKRLGLKIGDRVTAATVLGHVGHTGNAAKVVWRTEYDGTVQDLRHVHEKATLNGRIVDPDSLYTTITPAAPSGTPINQGDDHMAFQIRLQENGKLGRTLYIEPGFVSHIVHDDVVNVNNYVGVPGGGSTNQVSVDDARRLIEARGFNWATVNGLRAGEGVGRDGRVVNAGAAKW